MTEKTNSRIESEIEVKAYIQDLKYALNNGAKIAFQAKRLVDEKRDEKYTNQYTVFFAIPFWRKLQSIFGECCISKLEKVAELPDGRLRPAGSIADII